jgi:ribosome-associated toxin RatA of RatAB toxin-antitoxin module
VLQLQPDRMKAEIGIAFSGIHQTFTTHNTHEPGRTVVMKRVDGPFSNLDGQWSFTPLGQPGQRACKVELLLNYRFKNAALAALVGPVFDKIAGNLVDAFVKRAEHVYG